MEREFSSEEQIQSDFDKIKTNLKDFLNKFGTKMPAKIFNELHQFTLQPKGEADEYGSAVMTSILRIKNEGLLEEFKNLEPEVEKLLTNLAFYMNEGKMPEDESEDRLAA